MFIPGLGDVSTPKRAAAAVAASPGTAATAGARSGQLGALANPDRYANPRPVGGAPQPSTNGVTQQSTFNYPAALPALTAEQQAALASRRRLASRAFEETEANVARERARAEADALRAQSDVERQQQLQSRAGMQTLAGRGVGRSPMFVNPFQRQLAEQSQRQIGELQSGLANTLAQLESALRQAEIARDRELAQIDFDAGSFRSDVARLLGG